MEKHKAVRSLHRPPSHVGVLEDSKLDEVVGDDESMFGSIEDSCELAKKRLKKHEVKTSGQLEAILGRKVSPLDEAVLERVGIHNSDLYFEIMEAANAIFNENMSLPAMNAAILARVGPHHSRFFYKVRDAIAGLPTRLTNQTQATEACSSEEGTDGDEDDEVDEDDGKESPSSNAVEGFGCNAGYEAEIPKFNPNHSIEVEANGCINGYEADFSKVDPKSDHFNSSKLFVDSALHAPLLSHVSLCSSPRIGYKENIVSKSNCFVPLVDDESSHPMEFTHQQGPLKLAAHFSAHELETTSCSLPKISVQSNLSIVDSKNPCDVPFHNVGSPTTSGSQGGHHVLGGLIKKGDKLCEIKVGPSLVGKISICAAIKSDKGALSCGIQSIKQDFGAPHLKFAATSCDKSHIAAGIVIEPSHAAGGSLSTTRTEFVCDNVGGLPQEDKHLASAECTKVGGLPLNFKMDKSAFPIIPLDSRGQHGSQEVYNTTSYEDGENFGKGGHLVSAKANFLGPTVGYPCFERNGQVMVGGCGPLDDSHHSLVYLNNKVGGLPQEEVFLSSTVNTNVDGQSGSKVVDNATSVDVADFIKNGGHFNSTKVIVEGSSPCQLQNGLGGPEKDQEHVEAQNVPKKLFKDLFFPAQVLGRAYAPMGCDQEIGIPITSPLRGLPPFNLSFIDHGDRKEKLVLQVPKDLIIEGKREWENTLVGHFVGKKLPFSLVQSASLRLWGNAGLVDTLATDAGIFTLTSKVLL